MGRVRAAAAAAALLAAVVGALPALPARAGAAGAAGPCPDANGVTVVVDFHELGGGVVVRCAAGPQATGVAALKTAGFAVTGTARWGEAFICRIDGKPSAAEESCVDTPPVSAYWSYWSASAGGSWSYSQYGAAARTPPPGSFEGWSFALDRAASGALPPRVAPSRPSAPESPQRPAPEQPDQPDQPEQPDPPERPGQPGAPPGGGDRPAGPPAGQPPAASGSGGQPDPSGPTAGPRAPGSDPPTAPATGPGPGGTPLVPPDLDTAAAQTRDGIPAGTIVGIGLVTAVLVGAGVTVWRRRSAG